jgi:uncharacterized membrane protein
VAEAPATGDKPRAPRKARTTRASTPADATASPLPERRRNRRTSAAYTKPPVPKAREGEAGTATPAPPKKPRAPRTPAPTATRAAAKTAPEIAPPTPSERGPQAAAPAPSEPAAVAPPAPPASEPPMRAKRRRTPAISVGSPLRVVLAVALLANLLVLLGSPIPALAPLAGLVLVLALPIMLVWQKLDWVEADPAERIVCSVGVALLALMIGGLALNQLLVFSGVARPLDRTPVLIAVDLGLIGLLAWRRDRLHLPENVFRRLPQGSRLIAAGALAVVGAIIGAIRLNNGASGYFTVLALTGIASIFALVILRRARLTTTVISIVLYELALATLLMTSLRGWYVTGHDIQLEYQVFQLTASNGSWDMSRFQDPYNACMSITILPTVLSRLLHISDPYIFKVVFQAIFATCPVIVFLLARRFATTFVALLSTIYFIGFPTYFTDMPFLNRQELAFVFVGIGFLVATQPRWSTRRARIWFAVITSGVLLSHYSTNYVFIATLALAFFGGVGLDLLRVVRGRMRGRRVSLALTAPVIGLANIAVLAALTFAWSSPFTHTAGHLEQTVKTSVIGFFGSGGQRSSDTSYSLVAGKNQTPAERLRAFEKLTITSTARERAAGAYYPLKTVDRYPVKALLTPDLPVTAAGRMVERSGLSVSTINGLMRTGAASLLQLFVVIGLLVVVLGRATRFKPDREFTLIAAASMGVVLSQVILPNLSVEYGLLRAFQQSLIVLAPFLAAGSIAALSWVGRRRVSVAASFVALIFFLSLTGVIPQVLGGYPAQLHLDNSGKYYDIYYAHPQERRAFTWLEQRVASDRTRLVDAQIQSDLYTYNRLRSFGTTREDDIFPTLLRPGTYAFLGGPNVNRKISTFTFAGDEVTYRYPFGLLDSTKNLIYASNGAQIYH